MRTVIACMTACLTLGGFSGFSGFGMSAAAATSTDAAQQVTVVGSAHDETRVATSGTNVPLRTALRLIVPDDYSINLPNAGVWASTPVSWQQGESLAQTLNNAFAPNPGLIAQIDTDFRLVTVRYRQPFGTAPGAAAQTAAVTAQAAAATAQTAAATAPAFVPPGAAFGAAVQSAATPGSARTTTTAAGSGMAANTNASTAPIGTPATQLGATAPSPAASASVEANPGAGAAAADRPVAQVWRIEMSDRTIKTVLTRWAQQSGWQLMWEAPVDFSIDAAASVDGTFNDALQSVVSALANSNTPIQAILYQGNKVVRIVAKGAV